MIPLIKIKFIDFQIGCNITIGPKPAVTLKEKRTCFDKQGCLMICLVVLKSFHFLIHAGLEGLTEFQKPDQDIDPWYLCYLCHMEVDWKDIVDHVVTLLHRTKYIVSIQYN